ncbi:trigger factor [Ferviditalea candida]|uniref:Trigger factor n=1 Tax=Ferviditalea candida TaxID=3108399 RepID=A0ABU5ZH39_9BACL|nr:trigger factor [Paenibacillaceae bacterium T2]
MKASWEKIEKNQGVLEVEVDAEQVAEALDKAFKKVVRQINVPGFRKGKVPRAIFEARFGVESLYRDAIDIILPESYMNAVKETGIEPVDQPEIDIQEFEKAKPFRFKATVLVKPEVQLGEYKGIEVTLPDGTVTEEDLEAELKRLQERHAELVVLEEGTIENGDMAVIDFEGFVDGVAFEGGKSSNYALEVGSGTFIPGFEEQLIGMAKGEEKDITVTFPESYHSEELAGKEAVFKVKCNDIKRKNLPELDDEFAKDVSEFDTLEEFKADLTNQLREAKEKENEKRLEDEVISKASEAAEVEIPEVMVRNEIDRMLQDFSNRLRMQGMTLEMYSQFTGQSEQHLRDQMKEDAAKRVRSSLVIEAIAKAENVDASEEEINEELEKLSKMYRKSAEELRAIFEANGNMEDLKQDVISRKTVKLLVELSNKTTQVA